MNEHSIKLFYINFSKRFQDIFVLWFCLYESFNCTQTITQYTRYENEEERKMLHEL